MHNRSGRWSALATMMLCLAPVAVWANGGPVAWMSASGAGDIVPMDEHRVSLVSETLSIALSADGAHYRVDALYRLRNPGPAIKVRYGVPVAWYPPDLGDFDDSDRSARVLTTKAERVYAKTVGIEVAGHRYPCTLKDIRLDPASAHETAHVRAWCVSAIEIPAGDAVPLRLRYTGSFDYTDMVYSKSPFTEYEDRRLRYDLSPASHWAGPLPTLDVSIDPGRWGSYFRPSAPAGFASVGGRWTLHAEHADLAALRSITGTLDAAPMLSAERTAYKPDHPYTVTASSELAATASASYGPRNALDGNGATAWCAAHGSDPRQQWLEVRIVRSAERTYCGPQAYVIVPGYAKNAATWAANNRIRSIRLGACSDSAAGVDIPIAVAESFDAAAVEVPTANDDPLIAAFDPPHRRGEDRPPPAGAACVRVTVVDVDPGPTGDTCISEFKPVMDCG